MDSKTRCSESGVAVDSRNRGAFFVDPIKRSFEALEEDVDGYEDAVFLVDEVTSMDVVHTDASGGVLKHEVVVKGACRLPTLEFKIGDEFRLGRMGAFNVGLDGPDHAVAPLVERDTEKADDGGRDLVGEFRHAAKILERRGETEAVGIVDRAADDESATCSLNLPDIVF